MVRGTVAPALYFSSVLALELLPLLPLALPHGSVQLVGGQLVGILEG